MASGCDQPYTYPTSHFIFYKNVFVCYSNNNWGEPEQVVLCRIILCPTVYVPTRTYLHTYLCIFSTYMYIPFGPAMAPCKTWGKCAMHKHKADSTEVEGHMRCTMIWHWEESDSSTQNIIIIMSAKSFLYVAQ